MASHGSRTSSDDRDRTELGNHLTDRLPKLDSGWCLHNTRSNLLKTDSMLAPNNRMLIDRRLETQHWYYKADEST